MVDNGFLAVSAAGTRPSADYERNKAWNDPENLRLQDLGVSIFEYVPRRERSIASDYSTYFKAITGRDTAFDPSW